MGRLKKQVKSDPIPYFLPNYGEEEKEALLKCIETGWTTQGEQVEALENEFALLDGAKYALAVSSASVGLYLACLCHGNTKRAYIPEYSFISDYFAPIQANKLTWLIPPIGGNNFSIDYSMIQNDGGIVIPVHFAGVKCDMSKILNNNRFVIEDCAHCYPTKTDEYKGVIRVYSFYANKLLHCGDGGIITTDSEDIYKKIKSLRYLGINNSPKNRIAGNYDIENLGYKANLTDLQAAIIRPQLKNIEKNKQRRKEIIKKYNKLLNTNVMEGDGHLYPFLANSESHRVEIEEAFNKNGIGFSRHFRPIYDFSFFNRERPHDLKSLNMYNREISLPIYEKLTDEQIEIICNVINSLQM